MKKSIWIIPSLCLGFSALGQNIESTKPADGTIASPPAQSSTKTEVAKSSTPLNYSIWIGHTIDRHTGVFNFTNIEGNNDVARARQVNSSYHLGFGLTSGKFETILGIAHFRPVVDFGFLELEDPFTYDYTMVDFGFEERFHAMKWGAENSLFISAGFGGSSTLSAFQNKGSRYVDLLNGPVTYAPSIGIWYSYGVGIQHAITEKHRIVVGLSGRNRLTDYEMDPIDLSDPNQTQKLTFNSLGIHAALGIRL